MLQTLLIIILLPIALVSVLFSILFVCAVIENLKKNKKM